MPEAFRRTTAQNKLLDTPPITCKTSLPDPQKPATPPEVRRVHPAPVYALTFVRPTTKTQIKPSRDTNKKRRALTMGAPNTERWPQSISIKLYGGAVYRLLCQKKSSLESTSLISMRVRHGSFCRKAPLLEEHEERRPKSHTNHPSVRDSRHNKPYHRACFSLSLVSRHQFPPTKTVARNTRSRGGLAVPVQGANVAQRGAKQERPQYGQSIRLLIMAGGISCYMRARQRASGASAAVCAATKTMANYLPTNKRTHKT